MDLFSVASAAAACSTISQRALSNSVELEELANRLERSDRNLDTLEFFSTKLQQFRQHADYLEQCLIDSNNISERLQFLLARSLRLCDDATTSMDEQVKRVQKDTIHALNYGTVALYHDLIVANSRLFIFFTQLLSM
jgi:hypothetical protein